MKTDYGFFSDSRKLSFKAHPKPLKKTPLSFVFSLVFFICFVGKNFAQTTENFNSGIPAEWSIFESQTGLQTWAPTTDGYLATNAVSVNPSTNNIGDQNEAQYFLVTPQLLTPENGEIHFYTKQSDEIDNGAQYQVRISTATQPDINGFNIILETYTESTLNIGAQTIYEKKTVELPASIPEGFPIYIAFVAINTQNGATPTGDEWFIDDFSILEGCSAIDEADVTIEDITVDGAQVVWSHPEATNFELQVFPSGGVPSGAGIPVNDTSYTLANLDEQTEYDVYLRSICDNGTFSAWVGPFTFETLKFGLSCDTPIELTNLSATPYVLVDNLANWTNPDEVYSTQGTNCVGGSSTTNYLNGNKIFLSYTPTTSGLITLSQITGIGGSAEDNCYNSRSSLFVYEGCESVGVNCIAGVITNSAGALKTIPNLLVTAGQTYVIVVSSELSSTAGICFQLEISSPECAPPGDIQYSHLTENSVSFSWDNIGGFSDSWQYAVVATGAGEPTGAGTATSTNLGTLITSLDPATTYDMYVRSVCSGTPGVWSAPKTFTTQCTVFNTPYSTDFATATNVTPEACWTTIDANGDGTQWGFIGGYATMQTNDQQNENYDLYVSPQINFDGVQKQVRYKHRATQGISSYSLRLSITGVGIDDFTTIILPETQINNTSFQEVIVDIPAGITGNVNIAWVVAPNSNETALRLSIDDVFIEDKPTCPDPLAPYVLNITTNSAWLVWTVGDEETQWQVAIQDEGSGLPTGDGVIANSNFPYQANGLDSGHRYEYYVRAYCGTDDQSEWVGPVAFTTLCESYDSPFFESFNDDDSDTQKFCWEMLDNNNDGYTWTMVEEHAELRPPSFGGVSGFDDYLISPAINVDGIKQLKYKYRAEFSFFLGDPQFGLEVLMSTTNTNPSSFSVISPLETFTNSDYEEKSIIFEATGTVYFAFRVPPEYNDGYTVLNIDDVSITDAPSCPDPSNLIVNTTLVDSAQLSWTAGYNETTWNVVVQPEGSGVPTTTGVLANSTTYDVTGLSAETNYEFYVMANCDSGDGNWIGPVAFSTLCNAFTAPFVETFNTNSTSENCWQVINDNDDGETWELDSASFAYEGDQAAAMFTGSNGNNEDWLISPTITITENQRLRYYYRVYDSFFTEDLEVLLSTNGTGLDQFTTVLYDSDDDATLINNVEYKVKIINFPPGISGDVNIAFHVPYVLSTNSYRGQTLVIDNVNIEDIPNCPQPTNITLNNLTDTEVQVTWDANGSETAWEISVEPTGTDAPQGDTVPEYLYNATTNPFTVTGLSASTMYDIYVRAVCDTSSEWTGPKEVTTKCSFENLCQYTFILYSDSGLSVTLDVSQNNQLTQEMVFDGVEEGESFNVFLCSGVEFSLFFNSGTSPTQFANYHFDVINSDGVLVYESPTSLEPLRVAYSGIATCGIITCPQPTDLTVDATSVFSWTPGASESQWEVAVQPANNATIPQSGTVVSTPSYTPTATDFIDPTAATYEYFVRAICGADDTSYWSGPYVFVRNDDVTTALTLPINNTEFCDENITEVSFNNATVSTQAMTCNGTNGGDVWFQFTAESPVHIIEINSFEGSFYQSSGGIPFPDITMTLYKDNAGVLEEMTCTYDNLIVAMYSTELVVGDNYKVRLTSNNAEANSKLFNVCVKTPEDLCLVNTVNGGFEEPAIQQLSGVTTISVLQVVPGWRQNLDSSNSVFIWESLNAPGFEPYQGGQSVQVLSDQGTTTDPSDPNIKGLYRDFDTSETTLIDFSYAHLARFQGNTIQLFAGAPEGPFTMISEHLGGVLDWSLVTGTYNVPEGQTNTRFIFRPSDGNDIGNVIDAVNFLPDNTIITEAFDVDCNLPTATVQANGVGEWIAATSNPGTVTIDNSINGTGVITGFLQPGTYTFTWKTSYCSYDIALEYNGISDVPTVISPVEYCLNATAEALEATATATDYTLVWYAAATGGSGSATAPTPSTATVGNTSYFVAHSDENGCEGPRAEVIVTVNDAVTPELTFTYAETCVLDTESPLPTLADDFATGGTFSSTTLTVNATTGAIDMVSATAGTHSILYTYDGDDTTCTLAGNYAATIEFSTATAAVTTFDYGSTSFCELETTSVSPSLAIGFTTGGVFSSTTLSVNATTGIINLATATVGVHEITYTYTANDTDCAEDGATTITVNIIAATATVSSFSYAETTYCSNATTILPQLGDNFTSGGMFTAAAGLTINATTGEINIASSTAGDYTVTYQITEDITACTEASTSTFDISITQTVIPELIFSYDTLCIVATDNPTPVLAAGFTSGGTFSASTLTINATTGEIDMASATVGTHNILYTYSGDDSTCTLSGDYTATIQFTAATAAVTTFDYGVTTVCELETTTLSANLATGFTTGGTFSSETLTVDPATGDVNGTSLTAGTHSITYTVMGDDTSCTESGMFTVTLTVTAATTVTTDFVYAEDLYCSDTATISPELTTGFTSGGTFSAASGLVINATTGAINISASTIGNYTVTYEIADDTTTCVQGGASTFNITILDTIEVSISGACDDSDYILTATSTDDSFASEDVSYVWQDANGITVGNDSETFNVTEYAANNPTVIVPLQFSVTVNFGGCATTTTFITDRLSCSDIPRGISPDGNGKNDTFNLSGFGVVDLQIFNRYGKKVYNFSGTYTNQWYGQTNKGNLLPDGTYFYNLTKSDGSTATGWVYINTAH